VKFADVVGHERAVARLQRAAAEDRLAAAILLTGPAGIGKRALADALAARIVCATPAGGDACGVCPQCTRAASGAHPDVRAVTRDADRRDLRIEQVRELTRWLALQPLMARRKVGIIDEAHCLSEPAQNALLKTLEEPPGATVLVLTASSAALVLPTVRSRCQLVRLDPLPPDAVARVLETAGVDAARARELAPLAEGSPGRALELGGAEQTEARTRMLELLPRLRDADAAKISEAAQALARGPVEGALAAALAWYRDVLETTLADDALPLRNPGAEAAVRAAAARLDAAAVLRQLEALYATIRDLEKNANRMLTIETLLLALRAIERAAGPREDAA
jgi:DNA polymerase III subunit delta'